MAQREIKTGLVFLKPELIEGEIKKLEMYGEFILETPKLATKETLAENGLTPQIVNVLIGSKNTEGWAPYEYKWRFATNKEWSANVKKYGGVFQAI